jgi:hypothetical protein
MILKLILRNVDSTIGPGSSLFAVTLEICGQGRRPKASLSGPRRICSVNLITLIPYSSAHLMCFSHAVSLFCKVRTFVTLVKEKEEVYLGRCSN